MQFDKSKFKFLSKDFPDNPTKEQLEKEIARLENLSSFYYNKQLGEKIIINSSYGALASKYFVGFNLTVASSVTEMGRAIVKYGANILNKYFKEYWHKDTELHNKLGLLGVPSKIEKEVLRYGDTDSAYFSLEDVIDDLETRKLIPPKYKTITDFLLDLIELRMNDYITAAYDAFAKKYGTTNIQKFELEHILYNTIFLAKKKYVGDIAWKEGGQKFERTQKLKITGIEIVQSSTPKFARENLKELINYIFTNVDNFDISDLIKKLNILKNQFKLQDIDNISFSKSIGDYQKFILEDKKEFTFASGCPIHVRAAGYHNFLVNNSKEFKSKYKHIKTSDKVKFYHAKDSFCNVFAYLAGNHPYEIAPPMDVDTQFEKCIIDPLNRLLGPLGVGTVRPNLVSTKALF